MEEEKHFKYVILGGGVSAGYAAKEFAEQSLQPGELAIISKESMAPYERPALSKNYLLYLEVPPNIHICPPEWYIEKGIELFLNTEIVRVDVASKTLRSATGAIFKYDVLIVATGSASMKLSDWGVVNPEPKNVFYLRDISDAHKIRDVIKNKKGGKAMIGGAPYIAHEIAGVLKKRNWNVTMHFPEPWCQLHLFTPTMAVFYEAYYAIKGVKIQKGVATAEFYTHENGEVKAVKMTNGEVLEADIVIFVFYNVPRATLFYDQLEIEKSGIKTDGNLRTSYPNVYAIGNVATFPSKLYNDFRKVEQYDHATQSAVHAVKAIKASERGETIEPYDYLPHLYARPFGLSWEFYGDNVGDAVSFGDKYSVSSKAKFGAYWVNDGKIVGAFLEGGTAEENQAIAKVARVQPQVDDIIDWLEVEGLDFACSI